MKRAILVVFSVSICLQAGKVCSDERLRLVHAERLDRSTGIFELIGNVRLVQGEAELVCERARWFEQQNRIHLFGSVRIFDGKRSLTADTVTIDGTQRTEKATGSALLLVGTRSLSADKIDYDEKRDFSSAHGHVLIRDLVQFAVLSGDSGAYDRISDYAWVEGSPHAVKTDTASGEKIDIRGRKIEAWGEEQRIVVLDSVRIDKKDIRIRGCRAEYRIHDSTLSIDGTPSITVHGYRMGGERMDIRLAGLAFEGGKIQGRAEIFTEDSVAQDVLKGERMTVSATRDTVRQIVVDGQAESKTHIYDENHVLSGVHTSSGDRMVLTFRNDRLDRVDMSSRPGQCLGLYTPFDRNRPEMKTENR